MKIRFKIGLKLNKLNFIDKRLKTNAVIALSLSGQL